MSFRRNRALKVNTVVLTGMEDKSKIFQAAFGLFPLLKETARDDISGDRSGDEGNINEFFYEGKHPHIDVQIQLKDVMSIDSRSYMELTTEYRCAHCILLVYDPTVDDSLQTICEHYEHMILKMGVNAKMVLIRNNVNTRNEKAMISKIQEERTLDTTRSGKLLNEALQQSISGGVRFYKIYDLLTPGVRDDVSKFFMKDLLEILEDSNSSTSEEKRQCKRRSFFCCCFRSNRNSDVIEPFIQS